MPHVPYHYKVNWYLVTGNGSLSKRSLSPSLTVLYFQIVLGNQYVPVMYHVTKLQMNMARNAFLDQKFLKIYENLLFAGLFYL